MSQIEEPKRGKGIIITFAPQEDVRTTFQKKIYSWEELLNMQRLRFEIIGGCYTPKDFQEAG